MRRALYAVVKTRLSLLLLTAIVFLPAASGQGRRRPSLQPPPFTPSACPQLTLAEDVFAADVEVDDSFVYFTDGEGSVMRTPKGGGDPQLVGRVPDFVGVLAIDGTNAYALTVDINGTMGAVWSIPKAGGNPRLLASSILTPFELAVDATSVYWVSVGTPSGDSFLADGKLERVSKDGTGRKVLASSLNVPTTVVSDGTNVYFSESGLSAANKSAGLRAVPINGGTVQKITTAPGVLTVALTDTDIFYANLDFVAGGELLRRPKNGGSATSLVKALDFITHMAVAGDRVYYLNSDIVDSIEYVPVAGGARQIVVSGEFISEEFALDDCAVYSIDDFGSVNRSPR
jgi:hypothetical protein